MPWCDGDTVISRVADVNMQTEEEKVTIIRLHDVGTDNIATDKNIHGNPTGRLKTYVKHLTMADTVPPLTTHVLDTSNGLPAANVAMVLYIQNAQNGFDLVEKGKTNNDGRGGFLRGSKWQPGVYKLHFDTDGYFRNQNTSGFYPYVEVVFRIVDPSQHYHVNRLVKGSLSRLHNVALCWPHHITDVLYVRWANRIAVDVNLVIYWFPVLPGEHHKRGYGPQRPVRLGNTGLSRVPIAIALHERLPSQIAGGCLTDVSPVRNEMIKKQINRENATANKSLA
ncbi:hypothetical protein DPMN_007639 [Dreissena polymorpha]|uniref:hydroxyisourate hydrolase n=1 Tax=Dreissena polymorpha TaxID=45954 RepID=A0A9D4RWL3_DREPO|nr:hypothetical protein DPMN_007639 [Dreissena polymorpha]